MNLERLWVMIVVGYITSFIFTFTINCTRNWASKITVEIISRYSIDMPKCIMI